MQKHSWSRIRLTTALCGALLLAACSSRDTALEEKVARAEQAAQRAEQAQARAEKAAEKAQAFSGHGNNTNPSTLDPPSRAENDPNKTSQDPNSASLDPKPDNPDT